MTATSMATEPIAFLDLTELHAPLQSELEQLWSQAVSNSNFIGGGHVDRFEQLWAAYCDSPYAVGVANGTDALELVLSALDVGPGDEVIIPANTFVATAEAVATAGATPVFVDVDEATLLVTADLIERHITQRTRAVIVVHLYGSVPPMEPIEALCAAHGIYLVEDSAQAHGASHHGRRAGTFGIAGTFSFYPGKNLGALGDAGAIVTDNAAIADHVRVRANHGRGGHHLHVVSGRNSRLDAIQAGALAVKLVHLDAWNERRRRAHASYEAAFAGTPVTTLATPEGTDPVHHLEVIRVPDRAAVQAALDAASIGWGIHYAAPCHQHPAFEHFAPAEPLPVVERAAQTQLSLPMHPYLTEEDAAKVAEVVLGAVGP